MSFEGPDHVPHRCYSVTLSSIGGAKRVVRVITNRGENKAVFLATLGASGFLRRPDALDIEVRDDGPAPVDEHGVAILSGYACDRNEW